MEGRAEWLLAPSGDSEQKCAARRLLRELSLYYCSVLYTVHAQ